MEKEGTKVSRFAWIKTHFHKVTLADIFDIRVFGFALTLAWSYIVFFSTTIHFSDRNDVSHFNSVFGFSSVGILAVLLFGALFAPSFLKIMKHAKVGFVSTLLMSVAAIFLVMVDHRYFTQPWCSIFATVAGLGMGVLYLAWGEIFKKFSSVRLVMKASSAFLVATLLFALVVALPRPAGIAITVFLPLVIGFILFKILEVWKTPPLLTPVPMRRGAFFIRSLLSIGVIAFTESFMRALFFNAMPIINEGSYPWLFLLAMLIAATVIGATMLSSEALNYGFAYKTIVFVLAFIFLLLPLLHLGSFAANICALVIYSLVALLIWILLSQITGLYQLPALFVFGVGWGAYVAGSLAGTFGGALLSSFMELSPHILSATALVCVCLLFFAYLFIFNEESIMKLAKGEAENSQQYRPFRTRCEEVAKEYGLTERETEIMIMIAKGRSNPRIQEELDLTPGTVNTHMTHIYKKLDVHDKQELIDILEGLPRTDAILRPKPETRRQKSR